MYRYLQIFKLSCSLLLVAQVAFGQTTPPAATDEQVRDSTREKTPDSLRVKFYPRAFRFGTDLLGPIKSQTRGNYAAWEVNGDIDCGLYYLAFDYGSYGRSLDIRTGETYTNSGTYWRAGMDANLLKKDPEKNMVFMGFRYGRSSFQESTMLAISDPFFGSSQQTLNNTATAGWGEMTGGLRVKVWKGFWMGYTARMKFAVSVKGDDAFKTYEIPGYGLNRKGFYWGFNYQIFWSIPFTKTKKPAPPLPKE